MAKYLTKEDYDKSRVKIRTKLNEDALQIKADLEKHIEDEKPRWEKVDKTFENLAYLGEPDFRNTLTSIVKDREAQTYLGKKVVAILGTIGVIVGIIAGMFATLYYNHK